MLGDAMVTEYACCATPAELILRDNR